jgi:hypothetical protein
MRRGRESSIATSSRHRAEPASRAGQLAAGFGGVGGPEESSLWIASHPSVVAGEGDADGQRQRRLPGLGVDGAWQLSGARGRRPMRSSITSSKIDYRCACSRRASASASSRSDAASAGSRRSRDQARRRAAARRHRPARRPLEQRPADHLLERADLCADRALRVAEPVRSDAERALEVGDALQRLKVADLDARQLHLRHARSMSQPVLTSAARARLS